MGISEQKPRILVVEDDPSIALGLRVNLEAEGYDVALAEDGHEGLAKAREELDLIVLDVMIPKMNGLEVLRTLRAEGCKTPVIILTARSTEMDTVTGLDLGADDYMTKPFSLAELLARIRTVLRRTENGNGGTPQERWSFGEIEIDPRTREVWRRGKEVELTRTEFDVMAALWRVHERVLSREQILETVYGPNHHGTARTVDNFIAQLRSKLERDPSDPRHLLTVRGVGYRLAR